MKGNAMEEEKSRGEQGWKGVEEGGEVALVPQEDLLGNNMEETRMGTLPARGPSQI